MSKETKVHRKFEEIQVDYQGLCTKAGHTQYQIYTLQKELSMMNDSLRDLNIEAAEAKKAEDEKKEEK